MKYVLKGKGYLKNKNTKLFQRVYEINNIDCICLSGRTTSNGIENWFYKIDDFKIEDNILEIPEFLPQPIFKIKNTEIDCENWSYSVDIKKENAYQIK